MKKLLLLVLLVPFVFAISACDTDDTADVPVEGETVSLDGTVWNWQSTTMNDDTARTPDDPTKYAIEFKDDGTVAVQADCNNATGDYAVEDMNLTITLGPMTMAECEPGSLYMEYVQDLGNVQSFVMDGDDLILMLMFDSGTIRLSPAE